MERANAAGDTNSSSLGVVPDWLYRFFYFRGVKGSDAEFFVRRTFEFAVEHDQASLRQTAMLIYDLISSIEDKRSHLENLARYRGCDVSTAESIAQDVITNVLLNQWIFAKCYNLRHAEGAIARYLTVSLYHRIIDLARRNRTVKFSELDTSPAQSAAFEDSIVGLSNIDNIFGNLNVFFDEVQRFPGRFRLSSLEIEIVKWRWLDLATLQEVADRLNKPLSYVARHEKKAIEAMRDWLLKNNFTNSQEIEK